MNTPVLTPKEKQILALTAKGMEAKQAAAENRITESTVKQYKCTIFKKLGAVNSAHAVAIAKDRGLI